MREKRDREREKKNSNQPQVKDISKHGHAFPFPFAGASNQAAVGPVRFLKFPLLLTLMAPARGEVLKIAVLAGPPKLFNAWDPPELKRDVRATLRHNDPSPTDARRSKQLRSPNL